MRVVIASSVSRWYFYSQEIDSPEQDDEIEEDESDDGYSDDGFPTSKLLDQSERGIQTSSDIPSNRITFLSVVECAEDVGKKNMGSIAFAAAVLSTLQAAEYIIDGIEKLSSGYVKNTTVIVLAPVRWAVRALRSGAQTLNSYSLVYIGYA
jgi:hypothetical protein